MVFGQPPGVFAGKTARTRASARQACRAKVRRATSYKLRDRRNSCQIERSRRSLDTCGGPVPGSSASERTPPALTRVPSAGRPGMRPLGRAPASAPEVGRDCRPAGPPACRNPAGFCFEFASPSRWRAGRATAGPPRHAPGPASVQLGCQPATGLGENISFAAAATGYGTIQIIDSNDDNHLGRLERKLPPNSSSHLPHRLSQFSSHMPARGSNRVKWAESMGRAELETEPKSKPKPKLKLKLECWWPQARFGRRTPAQEVARTRRDNMSDNKPSGRKLTLSDFPSPGHIYHDALLPFTSRFHKFHAQWDESRWDDGMTPASCPWPMRAGPNQ